MDRLLLEKRNEFKERMDRCRNIESYLEQDQLLLRQRMIESEKHVKELDLKVVRHNRKASEEMSQAAERQKKVEQRTIEYEELERLESLSQRLIRMHILFIFIFYFLFFPLSPSICLLDMIFSLTAGFHVLSFPSTCR